MNRTAALLLAVTLHAARAAAGPATEPLVVDVPPPGADSSGHTVCTAAIQKAIDRCAGAGGGTVLLSKGRFLSGTLFLKSGVTLRIDEGATLLGSTEAADYPDARPARVRSFNDGRSQKQLIYGEDLHDVALTGKGTIDGQGGSFPMAPRGATPDRPFVIRLVACRNVRVEDLSLRASAFWMQHYLECDDLTVRGVRVVNHANWNNDAIDIDGCHGVRIEGLTVDSSDDGVTLKSTTPRACEDVTVTKCLIRTHAVGIKFGTESIGGFKRVRISDCDIRRSEFRKGEFGGRPDGKGGIGLMSLDGAEVDDVEISRVRIEGTMSPIFLRLHDRGRPSEPGKRKPVGSIRNVTLADITATGAGPTGSLVSGIPGHPIEGLTLRNVHVTTVGGVRKAELKPPADDLARASGAGPGMFGVEPASGILFYCVKGLVLDDVKAQASEPDERPGLAFADVTGLKVDGRPLAADSTPSPPGLAFLDGYLPPVKAPAARKE